MAVTLENGHQEEKKCEDDGEDRHDEPRPLNVKVEHRGIGRTIPAAWGV